MLSSDDRNDYYKFTLTNAGPFAFDATLSGFSPADFDLQLIQDRNGDGAVQSNEIMGSSARRSSQNEVLSHILFDPGDYFVRVKRFSGERGYTLTMSRDSIDTVGNNLIKRRNLGALSGSTTVSEFVGRIDTSDVYRVTVAEAGSLRVNFTSPTNGSVAADVIRDINGNRVINSGEILASLTTGPVLDGVVLPAAGAYFVRVKPVGNDDTSYDMSLSFSRQTPFSGTPILIGNGETRIEVENFDNGGQGVAYNDTDAADGPQNGVNFRSGEGVDLRTTNDSLGGNFRLATTKAGEFLEYTVRNQTSGLFNFDFRVSSPGNGATFHLEVDGIDVTGPVVIPNTGGVDSMVTIPSGLSNVAMSAGSHVLRLVFDAQTGGNPDIAGTMNFFTVRRV
jgi:hypothetical protein